MPEQTSQSFATDKSLFELWDFDTPLPSFMDMPDLDIVTHVAVERAQEGGYHYLHESGIAWFKGTLYAVWANHRTAEVNTKDELIRGRMSTDGGYTWSEAKTIIEAPAGGSTSYNHPAIGVANGKLWLFVTRWDNERPSTELLVLDEATGSFTTTGTIIPTLVPFRPPMKMANGNWIVSGESYWYDGAVAISHGDDFTKWDLSLIPNPDKLELTFVETTILERGNQLVAIVRPQDRHAAPVSVSDDFGKTWSPLVRSNFAIASTQPYCGMLSTGQQYLITGNYEEQRHLMSIAVTKPGGTKFERIWKIRHQQYPRVRLFGGWGEGSRAGQTTEWSYPAAIENDGKLYITYTQGKEDCCLSIIPISVLATE
ncbi:MAG TPA: exo-alpha-sialidase [Capsulimonadaceae bacterium]|jgi:hypothetical protein